MFRYIKANIPNAITCLNMLCGALACIMAFRNEEIMAGLAGYQWAFIFIGASAVFDFLDGAMARLLHAYSQIGKELDSLSDLISFGLAPTLLMFNTISSFSPGSAWAYIALIIVIFGGIRLAKFNVDDRQTTSFIGLPIPANALFWIGTVAWIHTYAYPGDIALAVITVLLSSLMVCGLPMFSLKFTSFDWKSNYKRYLLLLAAVVFVIFQGVTGFAWTVLLYIIMSAVSRRA
ncbi:MAG: CDP-diacylglycerol--serine O-phosphatidyltransferase [Paramuribaculum sp.]|nr:CDP-diacylglycerol--serine O-phosphatidyltransferase [Paramuribaculum sp.]